MNEEGFDYRFTAFSIPMALSVLVHGHKHDYTGFVNVAQSFWLDYTQSLKRGDWAFDSAERLDKNIITVKSVEPDPSQGAWFHSNDDKGTVDYTILAFLIFGTRAEAIYYFFFLLLFSSAALYMIQFHGSTVKLLMLDLFLCAFYVAMLTIPRSDQIPAVHCPRFFGALSFIAMMHILLLIWESEPLQLKNGLLAFAQVLIFLLVYNARTELLWQVLCVLFCAALALVGWLRRTPDATRQPSAAALKRLMFHCVWPAALLVAGFGALNVYTKAAYHPIYFQRHLSTHPFWKSLFMGLGSDHIWRVVDCPKVGGDSWVFCAAKRYCNQRGLPPDCLRWLQHNEQRPYERIVREMYLDLWLKHPSAVLKVYLVNRPAQLLYQFRSAMVAQPAARRPGVPTQYDPLRWEVIVALAILLVTAWCRVRREDVSCLVAIPSFAFLFSLIPPFIAYAAFHVLAAVFVSATFLMYCGLFGIIFLVKEMYLRRARIRTK